MTRTKDRFPPRFRTTLLTVVLGTAATVSCSACNSEEPWQFERNPFYAAEEGDLKSLRIHIRKDPKLLKKTDSAGWTLLHYAADGNQLEVISYLVEKGAKINQRNGGGYTPLHVAAMSAGRGASETGKLLIKLGSDPKARIKMPGMTLPGDSVLDIAARRGHADLVQALLKKGASPFTYWKRGSRKSIKDTALHRACIAQIAARYPRKAEYLSNRKVIKLLIPVVKDVNVRDLSNRTPLHIAAKNGEPHVVEFLLTTYPQVEINAKDGRGNTPLHIAAKAAADYARRYPNRSLEHHIATIRVLLKHKSNLTTKNFTGQTPRDLASGNKAIIELLF